MNGVHIAWDEAAPAGSESIGNGDNRIRSMKTDLRTALDDEHVFPSSGGTAGLHRVGSGRAFYGTQSRVSASTTSAPAGDGRLMLTSDTSALFGVGSGGTVFIGGNKVPSFGSFVPITMPQRRRIEMETGGVQEDADGIISVTYATQFNDTPFIVVQAHRTPAAAATQGSLVAFNTTWSSLTGFAGRIAEASNGGGVAAPGSNTSITWLAIGHRDL
jgi:hypothetical protein